MMARGRAVLRLALLTVVSVGAVAATGCLPGGSDLVPPGDDDDDGSPADAGPDANYQAVVPPEIDGQLVINEIMATNAYTVLDDKMASSDWVELYNPTDTDVPIKGYAFTDDFSQPRKAVVTQDVVVPAKGRVVLWLDGDPAAGPTHLDMKLAAEAADLGFSRPDRSYIQRLHYGEQVTDFSAQREPDGSNLWKIDWHPTPGEANHAGAGQPVGVQSPQAAPEQVPEAGDLSDLILGYDAVPQFGLIVSDQNAAKLEIKPDEYVPAMLVYDGRNYGPVGVRVKGVNSFEPFSKKPSLRISVSEYNDKARFFGLKDLTLNNMHSDFSMMHERIAYFLARRAGIPASRANHALLTVNGKFYGLYTNVETVKKQMVERWFTTDGGTLFEATDVDFVQSFISKYELESGPDDRTALEGVAMALTNPNPDAAIAAASAYVDIHQFQRFWAMCSLVAQFDSFPYSNPGDDYFAYVDKATGKLFFMPWGMDETFFSAQYDVKQVHSILAQTCLDSPACFQGYVDQVWELQKMTEDMGLEGERQRVIAQIAPYVQMDTRKSYTNADVADFQQQLHWFIVERRQNLATMLPPASGPQ